MPGVSPDRPVASAVPVRPQTFSHLAFLFMRRFFLLAAMMFNSAAAHARTVTATVYDSWYNGRADACGGTYEHWGVSAAHAWLPCGTRVRVTHGGRSLVVRVWDRCDCNSLNLSAGAAYRLGVPMNGTARVQVRY